MGGSRLPRRRLLRLAALGLPALGLASCGRLLPRLPTAPAPTPKPVALNVYYGPFFAAGGGQSPEGTLLRTILDAYHTAHPNVTVQATAVTQALMNNVAAWTDPTSPDHADLLLTAYHQLGDANLKDLAVAVDPYFRRDKTVTAAGFYPAALHLWEDAAGALFGLPRDVQPYNVVYYNRTLWKAAGLPDPPDGWTTDDFLAALQRLAQSGQRLPAGNPDHWAYADVNQNLAFYAFVFLFGGREQNYPAQPPRATFDAPAAIAGAQFYADLYVTYHYATALGYSPGPVPEFLLGHVPLLQGQVDLIPTFQGVQHPLDWDLTLLPLKAGVKQSWPGNGVVACLGKAISDAAAGWDLVKYLTAGEGMKTRAAVGDVHPAFKAIAESPFYLTSKPPLGKRLFNGVGMSQMIDFPPVASPASGAPPTAQPLPDYPAMLQDVNANLNDMLTGKADVAQVMREATQRANAVVWR